MKKLTALLIVLLFVLAGCGDKSTKVSNSKEVLFTVGKQSVTRQDLYEMMKDYDEGQVLASLIDEKIVDAKIETTDELTALVRDQINQLIEAGSLESTLENYGMTQEEYEAYLLNNAKAPKLFDLYIDAEYNRLFDDYFPFKARMIMVNVGTDPDAADDKVAAALQRIRNGEAFVTVAREVSDDQNIVEEHLATRNDISDANVLSFIVNGTDNLSGRIVSVDGTALFVVQIVERGKEPLRAEFTEYLKNDADFNSEVLHFYANEAKVQLFDLDYYNFFRNNYKEYLAD